ncbi:MAG: helix-turn-helix transcriptional regulator [Candidatus Doudnabacteria bacterium]|nr:helix-turn-helix transcriptional regulator [Candidatus Doudnabacteria bacterium]
MSKGKSLGQLFKEARRKKHLTQLEVAEKAGVHWNTVAKIERNEQDPHFPTALSIAEVLDIPVSELTKYYRHK